MVSVAVVNQKGGVGKTTVALGLASAAAAAGRRVLVVDLDPQANASTGLGVWEPDHTVDEALAQDRPGGLAPVVGPSAWEPPAASPGWDQAPDVAASSPLLAQREPQLANDPVGAQDRLAVALEGLDYDLVLIDCPPSLGLLTVNGLFAADRALVVTEPGAWASDGVAQILRTVERIRSRRHDDLAVAGIVVNRLGRTRDARYWYEQLVETYGELVLPPIHQRAAIPESAAQSLPIHGLGHRAGAPEAAAEFDQLLTASFAGPAPLTPEQGGPPMVDLRVEPVDAGPAPFSAPMPTVRTAGDLDHLNGAPLMAQYDPQRSRSRHRKADDEGPAPVDALLGPEPTPTPGGEPGDPTPGGSASLGASRMDVTEPVEPPPSPPDAEPGSTEPMLEGGFDPEAWSPDLDPTRRGGSGARRPVMWAAAVVATLAVIWVLVRRRRRPGPDANED